MKSYALSELARNTAAVRHDAARSPVTITEHNKPRFVLMAIEDFEKLAARARDPRRVLDTRDLADDDRDLLIAGLDALIAETGGD